jgi:cation transport protein ChaC
VLKREELTPERIDQIVREAKAAGYDWFLPREERERRLAEALAWWQRGSDAWVFGYGSLMWNPAFHYAECRPARLEGYRRSFCFWTPLGRGSPEKPGLMLAIEKGGVCDGMAFRVAAAEVESEFTILFNREMLSGIYDAVWVEVMDGGGRHLKAVTFVINPTHPQYCGRLEMDRKADHIAHAEGRRGTCRSYLFETADHLRGLGLRDPYIETLEDEVLRLRGGQR